MDKISSNPSYTPGIHFRIRVIRNFIFHKLYFTPTTVMLNTPVPENL